MAARLPIYAGDLPRERVRSVARGGLSQIAPEERARLGLDSPLPAPLADAVLRELEESHCGALPPQALGGMAVAQRYRDAHMADVLLGVAQRHGSAILIAGNGHVRADRGVPWHLRQRAPGNARHDRPPRGSRGRPDGAGRLRAARSRRPARCRPCHLHAQGGEGRPLREPPEMRKKGSDPSPPR